MSSEGLMDAGTYAWIVIVAFFLVFIALQIRTCLRNVRGNSENSFGDVCPDGCTAPPPSTSATRQPSSVYTIDMGDGRMPANYINGGYSITETGRKTSLPNDGLPSYEEAIGKTAPRASAPQPPTSIATINESTSPSNGSASDVPGTTEPTENGRPRRHRHHRHHRRHRNHQREDEENVEQRPDERPRHRRRGFRLRRHLAKMGRSHSS